MARLGKRDHAKLLQMVDVENRKVSEIAAEYGCTPANIYALLSKARRAGHPAEAPPAIASEAPIPEAAATPPASDLFAAAAPPPEVLLVAPSSALLAPAILRAPALPPRPVTDPRPSATIDILSKSPASKRGGSTAQPKSGFGLTMRTADGDESITPFRSLEDLLSAVKPILRASARNPNPVWFSIQPVDLYALEFDAA